MDECTLGSSLDGWKNSAIVAVKGPSITPEVSSYHTRRHDVRHHIPSSESRQGMGELFRERCTLYSMLDFFEIEFKKILKVQLNLTRQCREMEKSILWSQTHYNFLSFLIKSLQTIFKIKCGISFWKAGC